MIAIESGQNRFLDINNLEHRFPESLQGLDIPVTLLHNHPHSPAGYVLVYEVDFSKSTYMDEKEAKKKFYPCSYYLQDGNVIPYQYCDENISHDFDLITKNLFFFEGLGFKNYGTTVRPIRNVNEIETPTGHLYISMQNFKGHENDKYSQTATNGRKHDACYSRCHRTFMQAHYSVHCDQ